MLDLKIRRDKLLNRPQWDAGIEEWHRFFDTLTRDEYILYLLQWSRMLFTQNFDILSNLGRNQVSESVLINRLVGSGLFDEGICRGLIKEALAGGMICECGNGYYAYTKTKV